MEKLDIFKNKLAIAEHVDTRKGLLTRREIPHCAPRKCDGLIFILAGSCRYSFDDGMKFEAKKDDMLYLAKDAIYDMDVNCDRYEFFVLDFNFLCAETRKSAVYPIQSPAYIHQLFTKLCYSRNVDSPQAFAQKMGRIYRIIELTAGSADRTYMHVAGRERIDQSADRIHLNFSDKELSVSALAKNAGYSEVYFRKLFKRRFGQAPSRYIAQTRISHAIKLMESDGLSLAEISEECGFASLPYFNKVFKAFTGDTPAAYRRSIPKHPDIT